jgi:acyl carrier protein
MNDDDLRATVLDALSEVAPEIDTAAVRGDEPLQEQLDLDSMDFLTFLEAVAERTGVEVREQDYAAVRTLDGCVAYVREHAGRPAA